MKFFFKLLAKPLVKPLYSFFRFTLRHPIYRWFIILGSLLYIVSPIDLSPDVFPVLGWLDDGLLTTLIVTEVAQSLMAYMKSKKAGSETETGNASEQTVDVKLA
jgi:uncharacterized membrane protein YkvA (DUF1232 family)